MINSWRKSIVLLVVMMGGSLAIVFYKTNVYQTVSYYLGQTVAQKTAQWGLALQNIQVVGNRVMTTTEINQHINLPKGYPLLSIDSHRIRQSLETLQWIEKASISRQLPNTLVIQVTEHIPMAIWQYQGKYQLISQKGVVIGQSKMNRFLHLLLVVGEDVPHHMQELYDLLQVAPKITPHIQTAVRISKRRWTLITQSDIEILLPVEKPRETLLFLNGLQEKENILSRKISRIDLRQPDRIIVKLKDRKPPVIIIPSMSNNKSEQTT